MLMLVSDYDGTFYRKNDGKRGIALNCDAICEFRERGNLFVIATGRSFSSIKKEMTNYEIPYDYLICNDGSVVFDNHDMLLHAKMISNTEVEELIKYLQMIDISEFILYNTLGKTGKIDNIVELELTVDLYSKLEKLCELLLTTYPDLHVFKMHKQVFLRPRYFKDYGIQVLYSLLSNKPDYIYTIGNDKNDIEMLLKFKGYLMFDACVHVAGVQRCAGVRQLVKKII